MFHTGDRIVTEGWVGSAVGKAFAMEMWGPMFRFLWPMEKLVLVTCECNLGAPTAGWEGQAGEPREPGVHQKRKRESLFQAKWKARPKAVPCLPRDCHDRRACSYTHECVHTNSSPTHKYSSWFYLNEIYLHLRSSCFFWLIQCRKHRLWIGILYC